MPWLSPADRQQLLGPTGRPCPSCGTDLIRHYCRSCDEFFQSCRCTDPAENTHVPLGHRLYLWTAERILAIPDFD